MLTEAQLAAAAALLLDRARGAEWVVLSGSLPPGAPDNWYATLTPSLKRLGCKVAIDTSGAALDAVVDALPGAAFDLIKPNSDELAQLTGGDSSAFEAAARDGDLGEIVKAARALQVRGVANVLVTLGGAGAVLVNAQGAWAATSPKVPVLSTVGAGDSSVAGFLLAEVAGRSPGDCLANATTYRSAAACRRHCPVPKSCPLRAHVTRLPDHLDTPPNRKIPMQLITRELVALDADLGATKADVIASLAQLVADAGRADAAGLTADAMEREGKTATGCPAASPFHTAVPPP